MRTDVRWLLFWLLLTVGLLTMTAILIGNDLWFSAIGSALGALGTASRWGAWHAAVSERHHAEREGHR